MVAGSHPSLPASVRWATRLWGLLSGAMILGGIGYAFWGGWWWAPIGIAAGFLVESANRRSAAQLVANAAHGNKWFKAEMLKKGIIEELPVDEAVLD